MKNNDNIQINKLQKTILIIIKDIDKLCKKHNIPYYLFGGTALGAVRHQGFIPWDDDLDIAMLPGDYDRFLKLARKELDQTKYFVQEGYIDWPEDFSKIRLRGTHIKEVGDFYSDPAKDGVFIDIFRLDFGSNSKIGRFFQYIFGKILLVSNLKKQGYKPNSYKKHIIMMLANIIRHKSIIKLISNQYYKYNKSQTMWISRVLGETRLNNAFIPIDIFGHPIYVPFEDTKLPVPQDVHRYLKLTYGDYMKLPPIEKRVGHHMEGIDYGKYS